ncbi:MAG: hypothetical protein NVS4B2_25420 [Chloroflexota bacterium]
MAESMQAAGIQAKPAQVRTFLITDVRGYTRFTAEYGDEAAARLAERFATVAGEVFREHQGHDLEIRGDEVLAVFLSARHALRAAVAFQQRLHAEMHLDPTLPLHAGIGLDTGEAVPVRDGYRGGALNLAARLCSLAGPGEIFASEGVIHVVRKTAGLDFVDRGEVQLKGLSAPVRVIQIAPEGELPPNLPPIQPILVTHPTNLPDESTPFIGRAKQREEITRLLHDPLIRLMTLTGPGGTGKTRLALHMAAALLAEFRDGAFFVSLASLVDHRHVISAIADALGVHESGTQSLHEALLVRLRDKHLLLVLDNFEHLLEASTLVSALLDQCHDLHVLATSRIPLHLVREHEYAVPPLTVPDPNDVTSLEALSQYESIALFIDRARAAKAGFAVTNDNAPAVAEICFRLDGLALAIELAAARIKLFPPQALLPRLSSRLKLLTGGARDRPTRQQTLRGALEWSYNLLEAGDRTIFARLSVFAGGCDLDVAEAVCRLDDNGDLDVFEGIASLVDKSLLRQEGEDEPRFVMLETIREYALERLVESGMEDALRERHAEYHQSLAEDAQVHLKTHAGDKWLDRLDREHDNMRAALRWTLDHDDEESSVRMVGALEMFWFRRGYFREARAAMNELLERSSPASSLRRVKVLRMAGRQRILEGKLDAAAPLLRQALHMARDMRATNDEADVLGYLGIVAARQENYADATDFWQQGLTLAETAGDISRRAWYLDNLGGVAKYQGDVSRATELVEESLALYQQAGDVRGRAEALQDLAYLAIMRDDVARAEELLLESLRTVRQHRDKDHIATSFEGLARTAAVQGNVRRAARLWGAGEALREEIAVPLMPQQQALHDRFLARALAQAEQIKFALDWREGRLMTMEQSILYALGEEI